MSVKVTEESTTFREQEGTVVEVVAALKAQGWEVQFASYLGARLTHPSLPGHARVIEPKP